MSRRAGCCALVAVALTLAGCGGGSARRGSEPVGGASATADVTRARPAVEPTSAPAVPFAALESVNDSGVTGTGFLLRDETELRVSIEAEGLMAQQAHPQAIFLGRGDVPARCPTRADDRNGDGVVDYREGQRAYGAPAIDLRPFPVSDAVGFQYEQTVDIRPRLPLDSGIVLVQGMELHGVYDPTIPIACGLIRPDAGAKVELDTLNLSGVGATAAVAVRDRTLTVWISAAGLVPARAHALLVAVPDHGRRGSCPTDRLDRNHDGQLSLAEAAPAYGAPAVRLRPLAATSTSSSEQQTAKVPPGAGLNGAVILLQGMNVGGRYDPSIPVACGSVA